MDLQEHEPIRTLKANPERCILGNDKGVRKKRFVVKSSGLRKKQEPNGIGKDTKTGIEIVKELKEAACFLMMCGHHDVMNYGFSFFLDACRAAQNFQKMQILSMASAIGLAMGGKEAVENFLEQEK